MARAWINNVKHIRNGEPVDAGIAGRPDRTLESRTDYLKDRQDAADLGQALFIREAAVTSNVLVGQAVYFNSDTDRFEQALAGTEIDPTGVLQSTQASHVRGVCFFKHSATRADLLVLGWAELDLTLAVEGAVTAGDYYLSATRPGFLVTQRPPVSVPVLFTDGIRALVQPQNRHWLEDHIHYGFHLYAQPAGFVEDPGPGGSHRISDADADLPGWLPATHAVFANLVPAGAKYGYNLAAHPELARVWPPLPPGSAILLWEQGNGACEFLTDGDAVARWDAHGLWWFDDCRPPWDQAALGSSAALPGSSSASDCTRQPSPFRLLFFYTRMSFATDKTVVTSLEPAANSPIQVLNCDGVAAKTGALFLQFAGEFLLDDLNLSGHQVVKDVRGSRLRRGPVLEGLIAADETVSLTGTSQIMDGQEVFQGQVRIRANYNASERDLDVQLVRLESVQQRDYLDVLYLGFPPERSTGIRVKVKIPAANLPATPQVRLRFQLLGRTAGTLPPLTLSYRRLPEGSTTPTALGTTDTALDLTYDIDVAADEYVEVHSEPFEVAAGDLVFFSVIRQDDDDYSGELGILDITAVLESGS